jgi:hypothetical protein
MKVSPAIRLEHQLPKAAQPGTMGCGVDDVVNLAQIVVSGLSNPISAGL